MKIMNKKLYLFDFDGTISNRDSLFHFLFLTFGFRRILVKLIFNFHKLFITLVIKDKSAVKELILSVFLKGKLEKEIQILGVNYFKTSINSIIRPKFIEYVKKINRDISEVYIVSASLNFWLKDYATQNNFNLITTELEYEKGVFTGKFKGKNCKGIEKVNRIKKEIKLTAFDEIISFGDSIGDKEMFNISTEYHYKPFR